MYKINTHKISGVRNYAYNPDWKFVMANYVCIYRTCNDIAILISTETQNIFCTEYHLE